MRILLVEDDHALRRALAVALRAHGFSVFDVGDGSAALRAVGSLHYDIVLLDLGLPDVDGITLLPDLRRHHAGLVIVLSARRDQSDKVSALDAGADDYLTKPFGLPELLARIRAVGRRAGVADVVRTPHFTIDLARREVRDASASVVALSGTEWAVLAVLARARRRARHPRGPPGPGVGRTHGRTPQLRPRLHQRPASQARTNSGQAHLPTEPTRTRILARDRLKEPPSDPDGITIASGWQRPCAGRPSFHLRSETQRLVAHHRFCGHCRADGADDALANVPRSDNNTASKPGISSGSTFSTSSGQRPPTSFLSKLILNL